MKHVAHTFATRVCSELAGQGVAIFPEELGKAYEDRGRYRNRGNLYRVAYLALAALLLPAAVVGAALTIHGRWWGTAVYIGFWVLILMRWCLYLRMRMLGWKGRQFVVATLLLSAWALVVTLIVVLVPSAS